MAQLKLRPSERRLGCALKIGCPLQANDFSPGTSGCYFEPLAVRQLALCIGIDLFGDVGVAGGQAVAAGMKDERLTVGIFVILYFT